MISIVKQCIFNAVNRMVLYTKKPMIRGRRGQAMIEYLMVAVVLMSVIAILAVFLYSFKAYSGRVLDLAASEYP